MPKPRKLQEETLNSSQKFKSYKFSKQQKKIWQKLQVGDDAKLMKYLLTEKYQSELLGMRGKRGEWYLDGKKKPPSHVEVLHLAAVFSSAEVLSKLLDRGFNVKCFGSDEKLPLHYAAMYGKSANVRTLVERGSPVDLQDDMGRTPLYLAVQYDKPECCRILLQYGADQNAAIVDGGDVREIVSQSRNSAVLKVFREHEQLEMAATSRAGLNSSADLSGRLDNLANTTKREIHDFRETVQELIAQVNIRPSLQNSFAMPYNLRKSTGMRSAERRLHPVQEEEDLELSKLINLLMWSTCNLLNS